MKKIFFRLLAIVSVVLLARAAYLVLTAPPDPTYASANHDAVIAQLGHLFRQAAYSITWAIQLGYLAWVGLKWSKKPLVESSAADNGRG